MKGVRYRWKFLRTLASSEEGSMHVDAPFLEEEIQSPEIRGRTPEYCLVSPVLWTCSSKNGHGITEEHK
jgi:hypothetical protein